MANTQQEPHKAVRVLNQLASPLIKLLSSFQSSPLPVAKPLTMIVEDCVPTLPPIPMITGINAARAMAFSSKPSKTPMINAAKIPPTQLANSHGNLTLHFPRMI